MKGSIWYHFLMFPKFIGIECHIQPRKSDCSVGVKSKLMLKIKNEDVLSQENTVSTELCNISYVYPHWDK